MKETLLALIPALLGATAFAAQTPVSTKSVQVEDCKVEYRVFSTKFAAGRLLLDPYKSDKNHGIAQLLVLDADGGVVFHRAFEHRIRPVIASDFKEVEPGYLGYFVATGGATGWSGKYYFLGQDFQDVFLQPVPNYDASLDPRWAIHRPGGDYLFLFSKKRRKGAGGTSGEIEEMNSRGNVPFSWNAEDYLKLPRDSHGSLEINSLSWDTESALLLGLSAHHEIIEIAYPKGDSLWRISRADWKFPGDPLGGFEAPHSVTRLANGNLLLVDSRDRGTRAIEYRLDPANLTATMVWQYSSPDPRPIAFNASAQRLKNGDTLVAWGSTVSEVASSGELVREWVFADGYAVSGAYLQEDPR